jgi:octaprenyl-diphosphate synthase
MVAALRGGHPLGLPASKQRMHELDIAAGVVRAIDEELAEARAALAPFAKLAPVPLMLQLCEMLHKQVDNLSVQAGSP